MSDYGRARSRTLTGHPRVASAGAAIAGRARLTARSKRELACRQRLEQILGVGPHPFGQRLLAPRAALSRRRLLGRAAVA